jgi:hypothetical protein
LRRGDGTTLAAAAHEANGGDPVKGANHVNKAKEAINAIDNTLSQYGNSMDPCDVQDLLDLRRQLQQSLNGKYPPGS